MTMVLALIFKIHTGNQNLYLLGATSSGTKVRTIVTLVPAEYGRYRLTLPYSRSTMSYNVQMYFGCYSRKNAYV